MKTFLKQLWILSVCLVMFGLAGCAVTGSGGETFKNSVMTFAAVQSVAVLPFQNLTADDDAAARTRDAFMGMLLATEAIYVLPPGEVQRGIERTSLRDPSAPSNDAVPARRKMAPSSVRSTSTSSAARFFSRSTSRIFRENGQSG